jgi:hypothetical protein
MKKLAPLLPLVVAAGILAALAVAGGPIPTTVTVDTGGTIMDPVSADRDFGVAGHVESPNAKCLNNRTVTIRGLYATETKPHPFDIARTGRHGGFNGVGPSEHNSNTIGNATAKVPPKKIGPKQHPRKCDSAASH